MDEDIIHSILERVYVCIVLFTIFCFKPSSCLSRFHHIRCT